MMLGLLEPPTTKGRLKLGCVISAGKQHRAVGPADGLHVAGCRCADLRRLVAADHHRKLVPVGAVEFGACAVEVTLHCAHRHRQSVGDVAVA